MAFRLACGAFFPISDWWGRTQSIVGGAVPGQMASVHKKSAWASHKEQDSEQHPSEASASAPASRFLLEFLPWLALLMASDAEV